MRARLAVFLLPLAVATGLYAQEGAYTAAQAMRGKVAFENNCSECHMSDLAGRAGPALKGAPFMEHWRGKTVASLVEKIKTTMPADWRTQLSDARTLDVVAFLLQGNGYPAGDVELSADTAAALTITDSR